MQYTALGHLHRFQNVGGHPSPVVYLVVHLIVFGSGTRKVVLIEAQPNEAVITGIPLQVAVTSKRFENIDDALAWLLENPYCLVELTLVSDTFFATQDLKRIHESHDGIIFNHSMMATKIINGATNPRVNLDQDIQGLFKDYFCFKTQTGTQRGTIRVVQ
jgi:exonuclease SbcD